MQWGKHGSLPHGVLLGDLPRYQTLNSFYAIQTLLVADFWLGNVTRKGPWCFCHGYRRYRAFDDALLLADHLDAVLLLEQGGQRLPDVRVVLRDQDPDFWHGGG